MTDYPARERTRYVGPATYPPQMIPIVQLELPFLTADDAATIDQARDAVERQAARADAARRTAEADELRRLGDRLVGMLERNATAVRSARP